MPFTMRLIPDHSMYASVDDQHSTVQARHPCGVEFSPIQHHSVLRRVGDGIGLGMDRDVTGFKTKTP